MLCFVMHRTRELWSAAFGVSESDKDVLLLECFSIIAFFEPTAVSFWIWVIFEDFKPEWEQNLLRSS